MKYLVTILCAVALSFAGCGDDDKTDTAAAECTGADAGVDTGDAGAGGEAGDTADTDTGDAGAGGEAGDTGDDADAAE